MLCPNCGADAGESSRFCPACGTTLVRARDAEPTLGRLIDGKYRVEALLGEGGMGKVYRAQQLALDKPVVLKVLHPSLQSDRSTVERFQREARAASRLNHPNSISILDFGQAGDGTLFIAMELVAGRDLHRVLSQEWPLPEARIVRIMAQVLSALSDAHLAGVIHRDLKPENIMVEQRRGEPDFVKVLDFGIAKIQDAAGEEGRPLTRAGFVCGTPEYMSPEQVRGAALDARSDLYAVGVILYQLVTGLLPFDSDSPVGFATKHLTEVPLPPSQRRPGVAISPGLEALIMRALAKDPAERPQTAEAFREALLALGTPAAVRLQASASSAAGPAPLPLVPSGAVRASGAVSGGEVPAAPPSGAGARRGRPLAVKVLTGGMVAAAIGLALAFLVPNRTPSPPAAPPQAGAVQTPEAPVPLYAREVPLAERNAEAALRRMREGDLAYQAGDLTQAAAHYREAFQQDPLPELALKLGEVAWHRNALAEAQGWWRRHLRDRRDSKARPYIEALFPGLQADGAPP